MSGIYGFYCFDENSNLANYIVRKNGSVWDVHPVSNGKPLPRLGCYRSKKAVAQSLQNVFQVVIEAPAHSIVSDLPQNW